MFSARGGFFYNTSVPYIYMLSDASIYTSSAVKPDGSLWIWGRSNFGNLGLNDNTFRSVPTQLDSSSWTQVSNFNTHTYAIKSNGTLWAWGYGANGQLGNNTTINRSSPVQMGASTNWLYLPTLSDITSNSGAAINTSGQLYTWGFGSAGLLGNNSTISRSNPVQVAGSWSSIGVTNQNAAGITTDGNLWGWGDNSYKQLDNTTANRSSPVQLAAGLVYTKVAIGDRAFAAIANDSTAWVWGYNLTGQLGLNDLVSRSSPVQLNGSWTQISISSNRSYGIKSDGTLWGWGINDGTIGINAELSWSQISSGSHVVAIRSDGSLWTWGAGQNGQLGSGTTISRSIPVQISSSSWTQVSVNAQSSYAIKDDGTLWAWGLNSSGQLGINDTLRRSSPVQVSTSSWSQISASKQGAFVLGTTTDGGLYSWGINTNGILGLNDVVNRSSPTQVGTGVPYSVEFTTGNYLTIAGSSQFVFGTGDFTIECWFYPISNAGVFWDTRPTLSGSANIQLYYDSHYGYPSVQYYYSGTDRIHSSALTLNTWYHVALVRISGTTKMYLNGVQTGSDYTDSTDYNQIHTLYIGQGHDSSSQYTGSISNLRVNNGTGLYSGSFTPDRYLTNVAGTVLLTCQSSTIIDNSNNNFSITQNGTLTVVGNTGSQTLFAQVSAGESHSLALDSTNMLYAWGYNDAGQTGTIDSTISWTSLAKTYNAAANMATRSDGSLWVWGLNSSGQLGLGDTINRSSPVQLGTNSWSQVTVGSSSVAGILSDGTMWFWGDNSQGQLATNDTINRSSPVQFGTESWTSVYGAQAFGAIKSDGTLWTWGTNNNGTLGLGDTITRSSPVQVGTNSWIFISANSVGMAAIDINNNLYTWGANSSGQMGIGTTTARSSPVQVSGGGSWSMVAHANQSMSAIKSDGTLWSWGGGLYLGNGSTNLNGRSSPIQIGTSSWTFVTGGSTILGAITTANALWVWGSNTSGQLGDGTVVAKSSMVSIAGTYVKANMDAQSLFLSSTYMIKATGSNTGGNLGLNDTLNRSSPVQVGTGINSIIPVPTRVGTSSWTQISAGASFSMAIKSNNTLFAWGANDNGQLGQNNTIYRSSPVQVGTSSWSQISAGSNFALGVTIDNDILAWGDGALGQLNQFSNVGGRSTPTQLGQLSTMNNTNNVSVYAGFTTSFQINRIGMLWGWGASSNGQLTNTNASNTQAIAVVTTTSFSSPIQIGTSSWVSINAITVTANSGTGGMGVTTDNVLYAWGWASTGSTYLARNGNGTIVGIEPEPEPLTF